MGIKLDFVSSIKSIILQFIDVTDLIIKAKEFFDDQQDYII